MIRCGTCARFVKPERLNYNPFTCEVGKLFVVCKRCGEVEGDYDDFEELEHHFDLDGEPTENMVRKYG